MNNKRWKQFLNETKKPKVKKLFQKAKQIPYTFDWGLLGEQKRTPEIATFDFDDTLYATDTKTATPMVQAAKDLAAKGATIYVVSSRRNEPFNRGFIAKFVEENDIPLSGSPMEIDGIHLTNFRSKLDTLTKLGSEMHFDDDQEVGDEIQASNSEIKFMSVNPETGTLRRS
tara:strand:- start:892 stop:1404 length:513 start_codon:yes stop_codon:yes gene_type:complete